MFGLIKRIFMRLLISIVKASNHTIILIIQYLKQSEMYDSTYSY